MKIECPECGLTGKISLAAVPEEGLRTKCPKCRAEFMLRKDLAAFAPGELVSSCPACYYSTFTEEVFDICPKCGVVAAEYRRSEPMLSVPPPERPPQPQPSPGLDLRRLEEDRAREEERRRADEERLRSIVPPPEEEAPPEQAPEAPLPILLVGWGAIALGGVVAAIGAKGIFDFLAFVPTELPAPPPSSLSRFLSAGLLPSAEILLGAAAAVGGYLFLRLQAWARTLLEACSWGALLFGVGSELADVVGWFRRGEGAVYYLAGTGSFLLMVALWTVPLLLLIRYLRDDSVRSSLL